MDIFLNEVTVRVSIPYEGKPYEGFQCWFVLKLCSPEGSFGYIFLFFFFFPWRLCRLLNLGKSAVAFLIEKKWLTRIIIISASSFLSFFPYTQSIK